MKHVDDVAIFWDYENCPSPSNASGYSVVNKIRSAVQIFGSITTFKAYLEVTEQVSVIKSLALRSELQCSGVTLVDCPHNGRKDVADKMMLVDMFAHAIDNPAPSTVVLISGDRDFAYALSTLRLRRYRVILITLPSAHASLVAQASLCFDWAVDILGPLNNELGSKNKPQSPVRSRFAAEPDKYPYSTRKELAEDGWEPPEGCDLTQYLRQRAEERRNSTSIMPSPRRGFLTPPSDAGPNSASEVDTPKCSTQSSSFRTDSETRTNLSRNVSDIPSFASGSTRTTSPDVSTTSTNSFMFPTTRTTSNNTATSSTTLSFTAPPFSPPQTATPQTTTRSPSLTPSLPVAVAPLFKILIKCLQVHRSKGCPRPLRSSVALEIAENGETYAKAGVQRFRQYIELAVEQGIVEIGGEAGGAWIALRKEWRNVSCI